MDEASIADRARAVRAKVGLGFYMSITTLTDFKYEESVEKDADGVSWTVHTIKFRDPVDTPPVAT